MSTWNTVIYGAGRGGQLVMRELLQNADLGLHPIGFVDDDPRLHQLTVNRIPVLGTSGDLESILGSRPVASLVISTNKIPEERLSDVVEVYGGNHLDENGGNGKSLALRTVQGKDG